MAWENFEGMTEKVAWRVAFGPGLKFLTCALKHRDNNAHAPDRDTSQMNIACAHTMLPSLISRVMYQLPYVLNKCQTNLNLIAGVIPLTL